jgi:hypothetical protein
LLEPHSGGDGYIDTLFLEFENEDPHLVRTNVLPFRE